MASVIVEVDLDLDVEGGYETFIDALRERLADHPLRELYIDIYGDWLEDHPLLPVQLHPRQPARWIHINLMAQDEDTMEAMRVTVAVRDDNVYLMGFKNKNGHWYEFGSENENARFIQGSTFLECDISYRALLGGSEDFARINPGKNGAILAVRTLWHHVGRANAATKRHLACLCVMICECARMTLHYDTVRGGWDAAITTIEPRHVSYINIWAQMSRALISNNDEAYPVILDREYPVRLDRQGTLRVVHLLLNSPDKRRSRRRQQQERWPAPGGGGPGQRGRGSHPQLPQRSPSRPPPSSSGIGTQTRGRTAGHSVHGRALVELCDVEPIDSDWSTIDTIIVFDGKRGQIIYKNDNQYDSRTQAPYRKRDLLLHGPCKAISAEGSFVVQVDGIPVTDYRGNSSKASGEFLWDCYAQDVEYDNVRWDDVISTGTGHRMARVAYAVLSEAVEATVEVNLLLLPGITRVYGWIKARCPAIGSFLVSNQSDHVVLFSREHNEEVELVPSSDDSSMVPLELVRSVVAVPVHSPDSRLRIFVQLHARTPNNRSKVLLQGNIDIYFDKHTWEIRVESDGDIFVPPPPGGSSAGAFIQQTRARRCKVQVNVTSPGFHMLSPIRQSPTRDGFCSIS